MSSIDYVPDIPNQNNDPSFDAPNMRLNTNAIRDLIAIDHVGFNTNVSQSGYHNVIHQNNNGTRSGVGAVFSGIPAAIANVNQIFAALYTPDTTGGVIDTQLFNRTGLGGVSQLTGNLSQNDGWQWVGGILIQWGTVAFGGSQSHETAVVTFKDRVAGAIPFPNNCFVVIPQLQVASQSETIASNTIAIRSKSNTQFRWVYNSSSSSGSTAYPGFYWIAVGN